MPSDHFAQRTGRIAGNPNGQSAAEPLAVQRKVQRLGGGAASRTVIRHQPPARRGRDEIVRKVASRLGHIGVSNALAQILRPGETPGFIPSALQAARKAPARPAQC